MRGAFLGAAALGVGLSVALFGLVPREELGRISRPQLPGGEGTGLGGAGGDLLDRLPGIDGVGGLPLDVQPELGTGAGPVGEAAGGAGGAGGAAGGAGEDLAQAEEDPAILRADLDELAATVEEQGQALDELSGDLTAREELEDQAEESRQGRLAIYDDADDQLVAALRELESGTDEELAATLAAVADDLSIAAQDADGWAQQAEAGASGAAWSAVSIGVEALERSDGFDARLSLTLAVLQLREARRLALQA